MDNIKYTIETLDDINIHEGLTKEQIDSFEKKEKNCVNAFDYVDDYLTDARFSVDKNLFKEVMQEL